MSATPRQVTGYRRPLRVGRVHYGGLWFKHHFGPLTTRLASAAALLNRLRPSPMADGPLLGAVLLSGLGSLAAACLLGAALAGWVTTTKDDAGPAVLSAVIVGAVFLGLGYLVFASRRRRGRAERADG